MKNLEETYLLIWLAPYLGALLIILLKDSSEKVKGLLSVTSILVSSLISTLASVKVVLEHEEINLEYTWIKELGVTIGVNLDPLSALMALIVSWLSFLIAVYSIEYMRGDEGPTRYWFFFTFFVGSMLLLVVSDNMLTMFIGWEGTGLSSYALIGHWFRDQEEKCVGDVGRKALGIPMWFTPSHSGLRALVFTRLGDVGLLLGIGLIQATIGTLSFSQTLLHVNQLTLETIKRGVLLAFLFFYILGALAKSAQFPFHEWLVTAMTGPTSVSALIHAATMVKAGVYFFLRTLPIFVAMSEIAGEMGVPDVKIFLETIALIGAFTAFMMATMAVVSRELKLILAFSTASQLGYMFLGIAAGGLAGEAGLGLFAGFSHLASHAVFKASLFLAAGAVIHAVHSRFIDDMGQLYRHMKMTFIAFLLAGLSLSGIPPFMGFWSKDAVVAAAEKSGAEIAFILAVVTALLTPAYTFRMIIRVFDYKTLKEERHSVHHVHEAGLLMRIPYTLLAFLSLILGLTWPFFEKRLALLFHAPLHDLEPNPILLASTVSLALLGIVVSLYIYYFKKLMPFTKVSSSPFLSKLHGFLYDRWYINSLYYRTLNVILAVDKWLFKNINVRIIDQGYHHIIPKTFLGLSKISDRGIEKMLDKILHEKLVDGALNLSKTFTRIQTGIINHYMLLLWIGVSIILLILFVMGV